MAERKRFNEIIRECLQTLRALNEAMKERRLSGRMPERRDALAIYPTIR